MEGQESMPQKRLLSIIGTLSHACKVVSPGRTFLCRLIDLATWVANLDHFVRLNQAARSDLEWWCQFANQWNGKAMMYRRWKDLVQGMLVSDASGGCGCGAFFQDSWFQPEGSHITLKVRVPITLAAAVWGPKWQAWSEH